MPIRVPPARDIHKFPGVHFLDATTQEEAALPMRLILIFSFPAGSPAALHGMHLLGTGETDLAQIESLVKVRASVLCPTPRNTQVMLSTGGGKVRVRDILGVERQVERRGSTPDRESADKVLRGTSMNKRNYCRSGLRVRKSLQSLRCVGVVVTVTPFVECDSDRTAGRCIQMAPGYNRG